MLLVICHQKEDRVEGGIFIYLFIAFISPISKMLMTRLLVCFFIFIFSFLSLDLIKKIMA